MYIENLWLSGGLHFIIGNTISTQIGLYKDRNSFSERGFMCFLFGREAGYTEKGPFVVALEIWMGLPRCGQPQRHSR